MLVILWLFIGFFFLWFLFGLPVLDIFVVVVLFLIPLVSLWSSGVGYFVVVDLFVPLVSLWSSGVGYVVVVVCFFPLVSLRSSGVGYVFGCCLFVSLWFLFGLPVLLFFCSC